MRRNFEEWFYDKNIHGIEFENEFYHCTRLECGQIGWNAALDTMEEDFTAANNARNAIVLVRKFARENGHSEGGTMDQYLDRLEERATASVA